MSISRITPPALVALAVACAPEQPGISGKAHSGSKLAPVVQSLDATDPHAVQRDVTFSSYCVACHVGYDTNGHPVGRSLADAAAVNPSMYLFPPTNPALVLVNGTLVECSSCHDDGTAGYPFRTVLPASVFCSGCHDKSSDSGTPSVAITSPGDGATVQGTISVNAVATDDVRIAWIELFAGTSSASMSLVTGFAPTSGDVALPFDTTTLPNGPASFLVRAYDSAARAATATISVSISNPPPDTTPPLAGIASPSAGEFVRGSFPVWGVVLDRVGVVLAELWIGPSPDAPTTLVGSVAPAAGDVYFGVDTAGLADGPLALVLRAYDAAGNVGTASVTVLVDNTPPAVAISSPASGSTVKFTTTIAATASDASGIRMVDFYVDGSLLASVASPPYVATWTPVRKSGLHTITAVATDAAVNRASASVTVLAK